jgi:hypothetical protein
MFLFKFSVLQAVKKCQIYFAMVHDLILSDTVFVVYKVAYSGNIFFLLQLTQLCTRPRR